MTRPLLPAVGTGRRLHMYSRDGNGSASSEPANGTVQLEAGPLRTRTGWPRVLVLSASVGSGHVRAAQAVERALRRLCPQAEVHHADVLELSIGIFRRLYGGLYLDFIAKAPGVLRFFYNLMDRPRDCSSPSWWDRERVFLERFGLHRFLTLLESKPWDLIINTHFLPGEIIADLKRKGRLSAKQVMVTTDFEVTHSWITEPCELYTTATEEAALFMARQGVPRERISVHGIPIDPVFCERKSQAECRRRHGLFGDRPIVLQLAGRIGGERTEEVFRALLDTEAPLEIVVVTAHNTAAKKRLRLVDVPPRHRTTILGYTTQMDELMRAADLIVTKPGGLTTAEAMACGTPLVIVDPVPGQEERNSDLLLECGAAIKINHLLTLGYRLTELLHDSGRLARLRENAEQFGRPRAAYDIVQRSLALLQDEVSTSRFRIIDSHGHSSNGHHHGETPKAPASPDQRPALFDRFEVSALHMFARVWHRCLAGERVELPENGPAIVVANHPNYSDPAFLIGVCRRPVRFLHAADSFDTPILHLLFQKAGSIPVTRSGHDCGAVRAALAHLENGEIVGVFPQGEVSPRERPIEVYKHGAAYLALKSRAPVYPALIIGGPQSGSIPRDWLWPSPGVHVCIGSPVDLSRYYDRRLDQQLLEEVTRQIMNGVARLGQHSAAT